MDTATSSFLAQHVDEGEDKEAHVDEDKEAHFDEERAHACVNLATGQ